MQPCSRLRWNVPLPLRESTSSVGMPLQNRSLRLPLRRALRMGQSSHKCKKCWRYRLHLPPLRHHHHLEAMSLAAARDRSALPRALLARHR